MASSGYFLTSDSGQGSSAYYGRMIFEWWQTSSGISGSVGYHNISYHLKTYGGATNTWQNFYKGSMNVDGAGYTFASPTKAWSGGATVFGDYSKTLYTDSSGNRSFGASAQGGVYYNTINTSGSGSWWLDNIPLHASLSALSMDAGGVTAYDEGPLWLEYSNPANTTVYSFVEAPAGGTRIWTDTGGSRHDFYFDPSKIAALQQASPNSNSFTIRVGIYDTIGGIYYDYRDRTMYIKNDLGQANPDFSSFTFADSNSTTAAITGNNQVLIMGKSTLEATVSVANAASPKKYANMSSYVFSIGGYSSSAAWSSSADVTKSIGAVSDVYGTQSLSVKAVDSRGNYKTVSNSVNILYYESPYFSPNLKVEYTNNYDITSGITVSVADSVIAKISPLTLSGSDKNSVNSTNGVKFDISKGDNSSYTGTWVNVATSRTSGSADITATLSTIASDILTKMTGLTADNTVRWYIKFMITDALETQYYETYIDTGKPIFRVGIDGNVYNNEVKILNANDILYAYAYGDIGAELTANTYHTLNAFASSDITVSGSTATIVIPGIYVIHAQQLINCTGAVNYEIRKNNSTYVKGWVNNLQTDALVSCIVPLAAGDTIRIFHDTALAAAWQSLHSHWYIYLLKKT